MTIRALPDREAWWLLLQEHREQDERTALEQAGLTTREAEVMRWMAKGKTNEEIALILGTKPATVKKHLERIYIKLGVPNRTAAVMKRREIARTPLS